MADKLRLKAAVGSATKPVYFGADGIPQECSSISLTADAAKQLATAIKLQLTGDVTGEASLQVGGSTVQLTTTVANDSHTHDKQYVKLSGSTMTGNLVFEEIGAWPTPATETYPIASDGIQWSGSSDGIKLFYELTASNAGQLVFEARDDSNVKFLYRWENQAGTDVTISPGIITASQFKGNASTATTLAAARSLAFSGAVTASTVSFNGSQNVDFNITSLKESYLTWGGKAITGSISPIDGASSYLHSANRFQFANPAGITIEKSNDGGSSWSPYTGASDASKIGLVSGLGTTYRIGEKTSGITINDKLRVTIDATGCGVYTSLKKILLNINTYGSEKCFVLVERALKLDPAAFESVGTFEISGQSGWNSIPCSCAFGGGSTQNSNVAILRFTFYITTLDANYSNALTLQDMYFIGVTYWNWPSNMAKTGHIYSWDTNQNATFPNRVTASGGFGGNADSASQLQTARTLKIGNTGKAFNGAGNVEWTLSEIGALPLTGGTLTGALNLANGTWNKIGNDACLGDNNTAGHICIKGLNANTGIKFVPYDTGSVAQTITINGSGTMTISNNVNIPGTLAVTGAISAPGGINGNASTATSLATGRTLKIGSGSKSFNGSSDLTWTHNDIGAVVSTSWAAGSTAAGPKLTVTVNGVSSAQTEIPVATSTVSGVMTATTQSFSGNKTFFNALTARNDQALPNISFRSKSINTRHGLIGMATNLDSSTAPTKITSTHMTFRQYSYTSNSLTILPNYDEYYLPNATADKTGNSTYYLLTTKNLVTIAQGGTGASTASGARVNLGAAAAIKIGDYWGIGAPDGSTNLWIRTPVNGILPYQSGGASALGTSSWPFLTAYINTITGSLVGNASSASKVNNKLILKVNTGTSENTNLYTFDGSAAKTLDFKSGTNVTVSGAAGTITFSSPSLSGGTTATADATVVGGVTVSGHTITVAKKTVTAGLGISVTDTGSIVTVANTGVRSVARGSANGTISVNTNGTVADVAVKGLGSNAYTSTAYAGSATAGGAANFAKLLTSDSLVVPGRSGLQYFDAGLKTTASATANYAPTADWYYIIRMNHSNNTGYYVDIATCFHSDDMYFKRVVAGVNYGWIRLWRKGDLITGAVWNDYAEYRQSKDTVKPGQCVIENGDDSLSMSIKRLMPGAQIVSDTFGFAIGETDECKTPLAVAGRVLAYPYEPRNSYEAGDAVCSGPNGTISKMSREEIMMYPERIVGTVSAIPEYDTWGTGNVKVDGRIWIKVK